MHPLIRRSAGVLVGVALALAAAAPPADASWSSDHCHGGTLSISSWKRSQAKAYAAPMAKEGYEWNGGCYRLNDRDDTPGAPDSGGEGADCSGLVFRVWGLRAASGTQGYRRYDYTFAIHGPYTTAAYHAPAASYPFHLLGTKTYAATTYMDAFVYRTSSNTAGHIGLIYAEGSNGTDTIIEAKGDAQGTLIMTEAYRQSSVYHAVTREHWTPECSPRCTVRGAPSRFRVRHGFVTDA
jgi:hypothetical protein